jgi:hypothetical protein
MTSATRCLGEGHDDDHIGLLLYGRGGTSATSVGTMHPSRVKPERVVTAPTRVERGLASRTRPPHPADTFPLSVQPQSLRVSPGRAALDVAVRALCYWHGLRGVRTNLRRPVKEEGQ